MFKNQLKILELLNEFFQHFIGNLPVNGQYQVFQLGQGILLSTFPRSQHALVMMIWALILSAALIGIWKPALP